MTEAFTTPEGLTLSYERRGRGPLLVCHPGGPGGSAAEFYVEQPKAFRAAVTDSLL